MDWVWVEWMEGEWTPVVSADPRRSTESDISKQKQSVAYLQQSQHIKRPAGMPGYERPRLRIGKRPGLARRCSSGMAARQRQHMGRHVSFFYTLCESRLKRTYQIRGELGRKVR